MAQASGPKGSFDDAITQAIMQKQAGNNVQPDEAEAVDAPQEETAEMGEEGSPEEEAAETPEVEQSEQQTAQTAIQTAGTIAMAILRAGVT